MYTRDELKHALKNFKAKKDDVQKPAVSGTCHSNLSVQVMNLAVEY